MRAVCWQTRRMSTRAKRVIGNRPGLVRRATGFGTGGGVVLLPVACPLPTVTLASLCA